MITTLIFLLATPNVLLLGDSIRMGYQAEVRHELVEYAVEAPAMNCQSTAFTLEHWNDLVPAGKHYKIIHCNWGLHDIVPFNEISLAQYEANLTEIFQRLKPLSDVIVFATTTPIPPNTPSRRNADVIAYNNVAVRVARENDLLINDLYSFVLSEVPSECRRIADVHYPPCGSVLLGEEVARAIRAAKQVHMSLPWLPMAIAFAAIGVCMLRRSH